MPCAIISAIAQATILRVEPDMWIVAQSGTMNRHIAVDTHGYYSVERDRIVAADD